MNGKRFKLLSSLAGVLALALVSSAHAADWVRYVAQPGSKVTIDGTSTLHDWAMEGRIIGGYLELSADADLDPSQKTPAGIKDGKLPARVQVMIPVRAFKSGKNAMDEVMQEAMKESQHPRITYQLKSLTLKPDEHQPGTPFAFTALGDLTIAGVTKEATIDVTIQLLPDGRLKVLGTTPVDMTEFGITPPRPKLALGLIRTGENVTIQFDWITAKSGDK